MELQNSQLKPQKEKKVEDKNRNKNNGNKKNIVMNMVDVNPAISIITLDVSGLNLPIKRHY